MSTEFFLTRRTLLASGLSLSLTACGKDNPGNPHSPFSELEARTGGRLGVSLLNVRTNAQIGHRADERFGMCSTFKALLAGLILKDIENGHLEMDQMVFYDETDLVPYAPVTSKHLDDGQMSIAALAEAAQKTSDNVAANLLLEQIGGPAGFTARIRDMGDQTTRLDRIEPDMNLVPKGEIRDTTTPIAMARTLSNLLFGDILNPEHKALLARWMMDTQTGKRRIRAGMPENWRVGNKTGTGIAPIMANKYNDVAAIWPENRDPHILSIYYEAKTHNPKIEPASEAVLATAGSIAAELIVKGFD